MLNGQRYSQKTYSDGLWVRPLASTGELALTLYVAHFVIGLGMLGVVGHMENQTLVFACASAAVFCVVAVGYSFWWRKHFRRGPLEWVMRKLTD